MASYGSNWTKEVKRTPLVTSVYISAREVDLNLLEILFKEEF
jgi:hypothetical protein